MIRILAAAALALALAGPATAASKIEPIVSPGGIKAWLVRDSTVPMVALTAVMSLVAGSTVTSTPSISTTRR